MENVSVTLVQLQVEYKSKEKNIASAAKLLEQCATVGDITLLPEMFSTGYIFDTPDEIHRLSEDFNDSATIKALTVLAEKHETMIVAGIAEKEDNQYYNSVAVIDKNGLRDKYRKISQNKIDRQYFSRGSELLTFEYKGLRFGVAICFDIWFPEIMRGYQAVDAILHPANFGGQQSFSIAQARALENGQHIFTCNRVGQDVTDDFTANYCGGSKVYTPKGEELIQFNDAQSVGTVFVKDLSLAPQYNGISLHEEIKQICTVLA